MTKSSSNQTTKENKSKDALVGNEQAALLSSSESGFGNKENKKPKAPTTKKARTTKTKTKQPRKVKEVFLTIDRDASNNPTSPRRTWQMPAATMMTSPPPPIETKKAEKLYKTRLGLLESTTATVQVLKSAYQAHVAHHINLLENCGANDPMLNHSSQILSKISADVKSYEVHAHRLSCGIYYDNHNRRSFQLQQLQQQQQKQKQVMATRDSNTTSSTHAAIDTSITPSPILKSRGPESTCRRHHQQQQHPSPAVANIGNTAPIATPDIRSTITTVVDTSSKENNSVLAGVPR